MSTIPVDGFSVAIGTVATMLSTTFVWWKMYTDMKTKLGKIEVKLQMMSNTIDKFNTFQDEMLQRVSRLEAMVNNKKPG